MSETVKIRIVVDDRGSPVIKAFARKATRNMNQASKAVTKASREISRSLQGIAAGYMTRQFAALAMSIARFSDTARHNATALQAFSSHLQAITRAARELERTLIQVQAQMGGISRTSLPRPALPAAANTAGITPSAIGEMAELASTIAMASNPGQALALGVKVGAEALAEIISITANFEHIISATAAATGATQEEMKRLAEAAQELSEQSVFSAVQIAQAQAYLASAGMNVNQILQAQQPIIELATATQSNLLFTTQSVADALRDFGLSAQDASRVANVYAAAISSSSVTMQGLSEAMACVGPTASQFGQSIEQTVAQLMALHDAGLRGEQAGMALQTIMLRLQHPTSEAQRALARLGVSLTDSQGRARPLMAIMRDLARAHMDAGDAAAIFGLRTATAALTLASAAEKVARYRKGITGTAKASEMASKQTNNLWGDIKHLWGALSELALSIGQLLKPALRAIIQYFTYIIRQLTGLFQDLRKILSGLAQWGMKLWQRVEEGALAAFENIKTKLSEIGGEIKGKLGRAGKWILSWIPEGLKSKLSSYYKEATAGVKQTFSEVGKRLSAYVPPSLYNLLNHANHLAKALFPAGILEGFFKKALGVAGLASTYFKPQLRGKNSTSDLASIANEIEDNASRALRRVSTQAHHTANSLNKVKDNMLAIALAAARAAGAEEWGASWQGLEERIRRAELERYRARERAQKEYTQLMLRLTGTAEERKRYEMAQTLAKYKRLLDEGLITEQQYLQLKQALNEKYNRWIAERNKSALERMIEDWANVGKKIDDISLQALRGMHQALVSFWRDVFEGGKDAWEKLWNTLKNIAINALAEIATAITTNLIDRLLSSIFGGKEGNWLGQIADWIGSLFGGKTKGSFFSKLGNWVKEAWGTVSGWVKGAWEKLSSWLGFGMSKASVSAASAAAGPASIAADWAGINAEIAASQAAAAAAAAGPTSIAAEWAGINAEISAAQAAGSSGALLSAAAPALGMWAGLEGFAAIAGVPGPTETLLNAVGSIFGFGGDGGLTPAEALAELQRTLKAFHEEIEALGELSLESESITDLAGKLEVLAERAGMTTEQFHAMLEASDPLFAKWTEAAIVTSELDRRINNLVEEADRLASEMSYSGNSAAELRQRLLALVEALHLPQEQAGALREAIASLVGAWSEGSMSAEALAEALRMRFAAALESVTRSSSTTAATIRALAEAIRAVPASIESEISVGVHYGSAGGSQGVRHTTLPNGMHQLIMPTLAFEAHSGGYIPRLHYGGWAWGLRPDEVPAILQRGEFVLSREDVARLGGPAAVEALRRQGPGKQVSIQVEGPLVHVQGEGVDAQAIAEAVRGVLEEMATHGEAVGVANAVEVSV